MSATARVRALDRWLVFRQDFAAFRHAVEKKDWNEALVFSNRFASDSFLFAPPDDQIPLAFVGLALRVVAEELAIVAAHEGSRRSGQRQGLGDPAEMFDRFCDAINETLADPSSEVGRVGSALYKFETGVSSLGRDVHEAEAYTEIWDLGPDPRQRLSSFFIANRDILRNPRNVLCGTLGAEMARLSRVARFTEQDLCFYLVIRSLNLAYDYVKWELDGSDEEAKESAKTWIDQVSKRVADYLPTLDSRPVDDIWKETSRLVGDLVIEWRKDWMKYGQIGIPAIGGPARSPGSEPRESKASKFREDRRPKDE